MSIKAILSNGIQYADKVVTSGFETIGIYNSNAQHGILYGAGAAGLTKYLATAKRNWFPLLISGSVTLPLLWEGFQGHIHSDELEILGQNLPWFTIYEEPYAPEMIEQGLPPSAYVNAQEGNRALAWDTWKDYWASVIAADVFFIGGWEYRSKHGLDEDKELLRSRIKNGFKNTGLYFRNYFINDLKETPLYLRVGIRRAGARVNKKFPMVTKYFKRHKVPLVSTDLVSEKQDITATIGDSLG